MSLTQDVQTLNPGALIELFELDLSPIPGAPVDPVCFYSGVPGVTNPLLVFNAVEYSPWALEATGFEVNGKGSLPRPHIKVANTNGSITALVLTYQDILGAKVTRITTLKKYIDAVNFPGGVNPDADPTAEFQREIFVVERKVSEEKDVVEFELAASIDVWGVQIPRRQIIQNTCTWRYKSAECSWVSMGVYFKRDDTPTNDPTLDSCSKRLSGCKCRFGANAELPYGSYPAAGLL